MKKNTKKKVLTLTLVILLLSIAIVGGSLAWFTAEDEATNVFTVGSIEIDQNEYQLNEKGEEIPYVNQDKVFMPVVDMDRPSEDPNYQDKIVKVTNTGKNNAYVRTHIAIPTELVGYLILDINKNAGWDLIREVGTEIKIGDDKYTVYTFNYNPLLEPEQTSTAVLNGVYLDAKMDVQKNDKGELEFCYRDPGTGKFVFSGFVVKDANNNTKNVNVLVLTQAVQADGFKDAKDALESAFESKIPEFTI